MIESFKDKRLEKLFKEDINKGIPKDLQKRIKPRLEAIDSALGVSRRTVNEIIQECFTKTSRRVRQSTDTRVKTVISVI